jgi:hypothetical protein
MANSDSQNHVPDFPGDVVEVTVGGVVNVTGPPVGWNIIDGLRRKFTTSSQMQQGDDLMDNTRVLLKRHLQLIEVREQDAIRRSIEELVLTIYYMPRSAG